MFLVKIGVLSGNDSHSYGKWLIYSWFPMISLLKIVIFHIAMFEKPEGNRQSSDPSVIMFPGTDPATAGARLPSRRLRNTRWKKTSSPTALEAYIEEWTTSTSVMAVPQNRVDPKKVAILMGKDRETANFTDGFRVPLLMYPIFSEQKISQAIAFNVMSKS